MTEFTSVGMDMQVATMCLCTINAEEPNSIVKLYIQEAGHDGCYCHNAS